VGIGISLAIFPTDPAITRIATSIDCKKRKPQFFGNTNRSFNDSSDLDADQANFEAQMLSVSQVTSIGSGNI
jgi:hypothetical protein